MALTAAQKSATRKSAALIAACLAAAKADGQSGLPTVTVSVVGGNSSEKFTAKIGYAESATQNRECFIADATGRVKSYGRISEILSDVVAFAPSVTALPESASFQITIANPEALMPPVVVQTVTVLIARLVALRVKKKSLQLQSDLRGVEIASKAPMALGTPAQRASYQDLQDRKAALDLTLTLYVDQDAELVTAIVAMGGTAPAA